MNKFEELVHKEFNLWGELSSKVEYNSYKCLINKELKGSKSGFFNLALKANNSQIHIESELESIELLYKEEESLGNIIIQNENLNKKFDVVEDGEYFYTKSELIDLNKLSEKISITETDDIDSFAKTLSNGFGYDKSFEEGFVNRMKGIRSKLDCKFYLLYSDGKSISCASYFRMKGIDDYCLMNCATINEYKRRGYLSTLLNYSLNMIKSPVFTRTNNPDMMKLLEKNNFLSGGKFKVVTIESALENYEQK